jgi:hypothetical protein
MGLVVPHLVAWRERLLEEIVDLHWLVLRLVVLVALLLELQVLRTHSLRHQGRRHINIVIIPTHMDGLIRHPVVTSNWVDKINNGPEINISGPLFIALSCACPLSED